MSDPQPYIEPPDPFRAMGPDGGHFRPGVPADFPGAGGARHESPRDETRRAGHDGHHRRRQRSGGDSARQGGVAAAEPLFGEERMWATLLPLSTFVATFLGPLVLWLIFRSQYPGVDRVGRETLNFQITLAVYALMFGLLSVILIGIPFLIALPIFGVICTLIAAYRASRGEVYRYPVTFRIL